MKYIVTINGSYLNSFASYSQAYELVEIMQCKFPKAKIIIENI